MARAIGGKNLNSGIRGGLWEKKHRDAMGEAVWLFGWLVHRQTTQRNGTGLVLRGRSISYAEISADTGWPARTLQRWMATLQKAEPAYIEVKRSTYGHMVIRILKAKKFNPKQLEFPCVAALPGLPDVADLKSSGTPKVAESSPPDVADVHAKSGGVKDERKIEQKHLGRRAADAAEERDAAQPAALPASQSLPEWVPLRTWAAFLEMRRKIHRPMTPHAIDLAMRKLAVLKSEGHDPREVLEQSILNSWSGLYPIHQDADVGRKGVRCRAEQRTLNNLRAAGFIQ